jgi:hypothetical protein
MSTPDASQDKPGLTTLERLIALARRGRARYSERAAAFSQWLRAQLVADVDETGAARTGSRLGRFLARRHLVQRQQAYRRAGGKETSVARHALERAAELAQPRAGNGH